MKLIITAVLCALACMAQDNAKGQLVTLNPGPPSQAVSALNFYDASNNLTYRCMAVSVQPTFRWTRAATTITNVVDAANVATVTTSENHGLSTGNSITLSGATVDSDLNGTYVITVTGATTFTFVSDLVTDATYTDATMVISTTAPRSTAAIWSIRKYQYSGTNLSHEQWIAGTTSMNQVCDDRATLAAQ